MLIDWSTVFFQIINFLILVALLKRFLYGPIIRAMDERQKTIALRLSEAATAKNEAEAQNALLTKNQAEFAKARDTLEQAAQQEIEQWKNQSIERIKTDLANQRALWEVSLHEEQEDFLRKLRIHISQQVFLVAQKAMAELADASLEARLLDTFLEKINQQPNSEVADGDQKTNAIQVTTGFPLDTPQQEMLRTQLSLSFPTFAEVDFKEEEVLGFGIRLLANDQKWEWNLSRYMRDIEREIIGSMSMPFRKSE